jgi:predicted DNA-binding transcriptional regulator YafY
VNRLDRALALLLLLRGGRVWPATELAARLEVSTRTVYRDIETLNAVGVPVYAELGRAGGFRLLPGYFLPPVMFSTAEAVSLFLGLTLLRSLRAIPFAPELETSEQKLLAAVPERLRAILAAMPALVGFETIPDDAFHHERSSNHSPPQTTSAAAEGHVVADFLRAVLDRGSIVLHYHSPYQRHTQRLTVEPCGAFWDRGRWYLAGTTGADSAETRLWRADRVLGIAPQPGPATPKPAFDIRQLLGHKWLRAAMEQWRQESLVIIRLTRRQATRLQQDWYYRHADYAPLDGDQVLMTFGEDDRDVVLDLVRWLGPGAELVEPRAWRADLRTELRQILSQYAADDSA